MFYTEYAPKWEKAVQAARVLDTELEAREYDNAILLPLRRRKESPASAYNGWHEGGVCSGEHTFLAGLARKYPVADVNWGCIKGYSPSKTVYRDETVVFGGVLIDHFGHNLVDCLSRMWYFAKNTDTPYKFVFLMMTNHKKYVKDFFQLAGLDEDRYEIITEATQFRRVIIPDQAVFSISSTAHPDWLLFFDKIKENIRKTLPAPNADKLYLTRTQLPEEKVFETNERYFERFFSERGYVCVAPEKLSLAEQINLIMNASSIVTTMGTLSHMMLFANQNANCTILLRTPSEIVYPQIIIDLLKGYTCSYVEVTKEILPSPHSRGVPLYLHTDYFMQYLADQNISFTSEQTVEQLMKDIMGEYIGKYALNYRDPSAFKRIANFTAFDFVNAMNYALYGVKLDKKKYQKSKIVLENEALKKENERLKEIEKELNRLKNSTFWKLTKPLRLIAKKFRKLKKKVKSCLKS